jgi:hypothetical protein
MALFDNHDVTAVVAGVYEELGDREAALQWLGVALRAGHSAGQIETDPTFEKLRGDPRWAKHIAGTPSRKNKED